MPTNIATLVMSPRENAFIVDLAQDELALITGQMGGCCSLVVLWGNLDQDKGFANLRGQHAGGGPGNFNWDALKKDVPNTTHTRYVMACAPGDFTEPNSYVGKVKAALAEEKLVWTAIDMHGISNAYIDRFGTATDFEKKEKPSDGYEIRNADERMRF